MRHFSFLLLFAISSLLLWLPTSAVRSEDKEPLAKADDWSFQPVVRPAVPAVPAAWKAWVRTPLDAFVLQKLLANQLKPSPEAERRVLARRVSIDLTGLPPTPDELDAFANDMSKEAYENSSIGCWRRRDTAYAGRATGSMWHTTRTRTGRIRIASAPMRGRTATT